MIKKKKVCQGLLSTSNKFIIQRYLCLWLLVIGSISNDPDVLPTITIKEIPYIIFNHGLTKLFPLSQKLPSGNLY